MYADLNAKLLDLKQELEEQRQLWVEEKEQLLKQVQKLQQESSGTLLLFKQSINQRLFCIK